MSPDELLDSLADKMVELVGDQHEVLAEVGSVVHYEDGRSLRVSVWKREGFVYEVLQRAASKAEEIATDDPWGRE